MTSSKTQSTSNMIINLLFSCIDTPIGNICQLFDNHNLLMSALEHTGVCEKVKKWSSRK